MSLSQTDEMADVTSSSLEVEDVTKMSDPLAEDIMRTSNFSLPDYVMFALMLVMSMGVGVYSAVRARGNFTVSEFLLGGRQMPALPVALSLLGGVVSALSILGNATEIYLYGTQLTLNLFGSIFGVIILNDLILPIFFNLNLVSVVHYLELRFNSGVLRRLATLCQLMAMFFYLGMCLYAPSLALSSVTSIPTWASILFLGVVCTFYVSIGGVRAVVYTDVVQTTLMFCGVMAVVLKVCANLGGASVVWDIADEGGRLEFFNMDPSPFTRHTVWSTSMLGVYFIISVIGFSQPQYQRLISVRDIKECKWLMKVFLVGLFILWGLFYFSGLVAYANYRDCDPLSSGRIKMADQIIPYLVMDKLGTFPGLPGLFVAAVYGGVLSSMSSQANSIACLVWEDLLKDIRPFSNFTPTSKTLVVKCLSAIAGLISMGLAMMAGGLGTLFNVAYTLAASIQGPLDGVFIAGIFIPWANKTGAVVGLVASFIISQWQAVGKMMREGYSPQQLPFSTDGCPENLLNSTFFSTTTSTTTPLPVVEEAPPSHTFYDISYCYTGFISISITVIVCSIVSIITGPSHPDDVDGLLLNPTCARLYRGLWRHLARLGLARELQNKGRKGEGKEEACTLTSVTTQTVLILDQDSLPQVKITEEGSEKALTQIH